jgi:alanine racemase
MRVNVDLNAIKHNYEFFNRMVAPAKCAAVVKSNAYGLGLGPIAQTLFECGARSFIVSFVSEAIELATQIARNSKEYLLEKIMLGGDFNVPAYNEGTGYIVYVLYPETPEDWKNILLFRFIPMINSLRDLGMYEKYANKLNRILPCVCNVDTGLHKRGMKASDVPELGQYLKIRLATPNYDRQTDEDKDRRHTYFKFVMSHPTAVSLNDENSRTFYPPRLATDPRQASVTSVSLATDPDPRRASVGMPVCDSLDLTDPDPRRASVETPVCDALHDRSRTARSNYARVLAQLEQLEQIRATLQDAGGQELPCSFCNTYWAAVFAARGMPVDNPRIGSGLYGLTDVPGTRLCAAIWVRVVDVQTINGGESIGYEGEFFCERATRVAVLHVGYNDGIGSKQTKVGINGNICSILSLYMDTIVVDIGSVDVNIGDWGRILDQSTLYVACYKLRPGVLFEYNPLHPSEQ